MSQDLRPVDLSLKRSAVQLIVAETLRGSGSSSLKRSAVQIVFDHGVVEEASFNHGVVERH